MEPNSWALIVPMANEEKEFEPFIAALIAQLDRLPRGKVFLIVDRVSADRTRELCEALQQRDDRFVAVWAPENRNVVDAYLRGYREAYDRGHGPIIEMDAGLSHDPAALPSFLSRLNEGFGCVFGSRFVNGGSIDTTSRWRWFLSRGGTLISNLLLGSKMRDMTSGYQGFQRQIVRHFLDHGLRSKAHFYQTELRYLLRETKWIETPIHYRTPSPSVSRGAVIDSIKVLLHYTGMRLIGRPARIRPK